MTGHWAGTRFTLSREQLVQIDTLDKAAQSLVARTFQKAMTTAYARIWPKEVVAVLSATQWAKQVMPVLTEEELQEQQEQVGGLPVSEGVHPTEHMHMDGLVDMDVEF